MNGLGQIPKLLSSIDSLVSGNSGTKEIGPASAPTLPSHGSNNPSQKVTAMNMETNSTTAPVAASKVIDVEKLRACSMKELHDFRSVVRHLAEAITAFNCQPRFGCEEASRLNTAGELLDDICNLMSHLEDEAVKVAKAACPSTPRETEYRAWAILSYEADCSDDLNEFAVLAAVAARDEAAALFAERHAARKAGAA